jgi:hypothetical protein
MGRVGLVDITVGNAARLGASQRSTTRRCASHHIATQRESRWDIPAALARLARTVRLKRSSACGSETVWRSRAMPYRAADEIEFTLRIGGGDPRSISSGSSSPSPEHADCWHLGPNDRTLPPVRATRGPSGEVVLPGGSQSRAGFVLRVHRAIESRRRPNVYRHEPFPRNRFME